MTGNKHKYGNLHAKSYNFKWNDKVKNRLKPFVHYLLNASGQNSAWRTIALDTLYPPNIYMNNME